MKSFNGRALIALVTGTVAVAAACSEPDRSFEAAGGNDGSDAGDTSQSGGGASDRAGNAGAASKAGAPNHGGAFNAGGDAGMGATAVGGDAGTGGDRGNGDSGAAGEPAVPECGAPGTACCSGNACVPNATCGAASCKCAANYTACADECRNFDNDPKNCGACGHDCLGGVCDTGECQPVNVVVGESGLTRMTTDGTYLYWTGHTAPSSGYYVSRRRVDASDAVKVLAGSELGGNDLVVGGHKLYWVAQQHLRVCDLPDCVTGPSDAITQLLPNSDVSLHFEPSKGSLFFGSSPGYPYQGGSTLMLPAGGTALIAIGPSQAAAYAWVNDANNVYWLNTSTYTDPAGAQNADGGIWRYRISDGATAQLVTGLRGDVAELAIGGSALFFAGFQQQTPGQYTNAVIRAPLPNGLAQGSVPTFAPAVGVRGLLADDSSVYFADAAQTSGTISRCPVAACPTPEVIVPGIENPDLQAQDAVSIYWKSTHPMNNGYTSVLVQRLAK